ncbi:MAG: Fic family protein, partial [Thermoleophilaceae bacterium]
RAAVAHLYIAWVHPFGDGNGRTARLVEFGILTAAGVPSVAAHLQSNHYNATRDAYYRQLDYASKSGGDLQRFLLYAAQGFVDGLQQQLDYVHQLIFEISWRSYVDDAFAGEDTPAPRRQRQLVFGLPPDGWVSRADVPTLSPELASAYAGKGAKTVTRDLNALEQRGLIEREGGRVRARRETMLGFLPRVAGEPVIL